MSYDAGAEFPADDHPFRAHSTSPHLVSEPDTAQQSERLLINCEENNGLDSPSTKVQRSTLAGEEAAAASLNPADSGEGIVQKTTTKEEEAENAIEVPEVRKSGRKSGSKSRKKSRKRTKSAHLIVRIPAAVPCGVDEQPKPDDLVKTKTVDKDRNRVSFDKSSQPNNRTARRRMNSAPIIRPQLQQPISNEVKMLQKLAELQALLSRDYRQEAKICYSRGLAESGIMWRSYTAQAAASCASRETEHLECDDSGRERLIARPKTGTNRLAGKDNSEAKGRIRVRRVPSTIGEF